MGTYSLTIADDVMEAAKRAAIEENISLDLLLSALIADGIEHRRALTILRDRAARGNADAALAILDRVPAVNPDPGDELVDGQVL